MGIGKWLDFVLLIIVLATGIFILPTFFFEVSSPVAAQSEDKTAMDTDGSLYIGEVLKTGADLFMALTVTDEYTPFPKSIRINSTPVIDLNKSWVADRVQNIQKIYAPNGQWGLCSMLDWTITSVEYIQNNGDPYIQYILEDVP